MSQASAATSCDQQNGIVDTWTGAVDAAWSTPGNWDQGRAPTAIDDAVVPAVSAPDNALDDTSGTPFQVCNLSLEPKDNAGALAPAVTLSVAGDVTVSGPTDA